MLNTMASNVVDDYDINNDIEADYGYDQLHSDSELRMAVGATANRVGIPGQWLADILAYESGFSPATQTDSGAAGLVQFTAGDGGMGRIAQELGVTEEEVPMQLANMKPSQQLQHVGDYLEQYGPYSRLEDVVSAVYGGEQLLNLDDTQRAYARDEVNNNYNVVDYLNNLGEDVGRSYQHTYLRGRSRRRTHTRPVAGCPECEAMMYEDTFIPHK